MRQVAWLHPLAVFLFIFAVFLWSAPGTVTLEDDGYFILAAYYNGIAHPPGYPLYTLLAHISTFIPSGSEAFRVHALSALFGAASCAFLWPVAFMLFREKSIAYLVALGLGFSRVFWSQSIIAEVYSLHVMIFILLLLTALCVHRAEKNNRKIHYLVVFFFLSGLGLSNHWPLLLLAMPCLAAVLWPQRGIIIQNLHRLIPFTAIGLLPYLWLLYRSGTNPEIAFFGPVKNLSELLFYIARGPYSGIDTSPSAGLYDRFYFAVYFFRETFIQFGIAGIILVIIGSARQWRYFAPHVCFALVLGFLIPSLGLICLLDFDYDFLHQLTFRVYPLTAYVVCSIWLGAGAMAVLDFFSKNTRQQMKLLTCKPFLVVLVVATVFFNNVAANYRANDTWAEEYAVTLLETLPENAALFVTGDTTVGPVAYMHNIRGTREDIELYSLAGTLFNNRLFHPLEADDKEIATSINSFINSAARPVLYTGYLEHDYGREYYGLYYRFLKEQEKGFQRIIALPEILGYFERIYLQGLPADDWEKIHYRTVLASGCSLLSLLADHPGHAVNDRKLEELKNSLCSNLLGQYIQIGILLNSDSPQLRRLEHHIETASGYLDQVIVKEQYSKIDYFRGRLSLLRKNHREAGEYFNSSIEKWPHPSNPSIDALEKLAKSSIETGH